MVTKDHCPRGKIYPSEMDVKFAVAEGLLQGRRTSGFHHCDNCGGWHIGLKERSGPKIKKCPATVKRCFPTEEDADEEVEKLAARGRDEKSTYQCEHCSEWHLTSITREEYERCKSK